MHWQLVFFQNWHQHMCADKRRYFYTCLFASWINKQKQNKCHSTLWSGIKVRSSGATMTGHLVSAKFLGNEGSSRLMMKKYLIFKCPHTFGHLTYRNNLMWSLYMTVFQTFSNVESRREFGFQFFQLGTKHKSALYKVYFFFLSSSHLIDKEQGETIVLQVIKAG